MPRRPAIPPLRALELRELQAILSNIRERLDQLDASVATAASTVSTTTSSTASSASTAARADTATALATARAFDLSGVTTDGPHNFDGTSNVTIEILEVPLALLEQDSATVGQALVWDGSGGWTPATLVDTDGTVDHGALLGLSDDDHPQYLNEARANALYSPLGHTHATTDVTGLVELIEDTIGTSLVAGAGISIAYDDGTGDTTVEATGGGGFANPMTDFGDLITAQSAGSPVRLPVGTEGQVLRVVSGLPAWDDEAAGGGGMSNPMLDFGDLIVGQSAGSPGRLAPGTEGQVLTMASGLPAWEAPGSDPWTYLYLGSDHVNSTLVASDIPNLEVLFAGAGKFWIEGRLLVQTANTASVPRLTCREPDNANGAWMIWQTAGATSSLTATGGTGVSGNFTATGTTRSANLPMQAQVDAYYVATAAATTPWKMSLLSETSGTAVRVLAGSFIRWRQLP